MEEKTLILRPWKLSDKERLVKYGNNKKIADNMRDRFPHPYTEADADKFLEIAMRDDPTKIFAIEIDGEVGGSIGIFPQEDISRLNAEVGYWIGEKYWGQGYATRALKQIIEYGFKTFPIERIFAIPFPHNTASHKVVQKCGMKLEAIIPQCLIKNGVIMDELIYAIRRGVVNHPYPSPSKNRWGERISA